jgi:superfamily II DNA helicase RecQ
MTKKIKKVQYTLNPSVYNLSDNEIKKIIRGAEDIVYHGGRNILAKILKGSKDKKLLNLKLYKNPSYGVFNEKSIEDITSMIDRMIAEGYLAVEYDYRLPFLAYEKKGLEIAKDLISDEFFEKINEASASNDYSFALNLKDKNRETIFILLEKIRKSNDNKFIPFLEYWKSIDYKKVQERINSVIGSLYK